MLCIYVEISCKYDRVTNMSYYLTSSLKIICVYHYIAAMYCYDVYINVVYKMKALNVVTLQTRGQYVMACAFSSREGQINAFLWCAAV